MEKIDLKTYEVTAQDGALNRLITEIKNDDEVYRKLKDLGLSNKEFKDNIAVIISYYEDVKYCRNCPGYKKCQKELPHLCASLVRSGRFIEREISPCKLLFEAMEKESKFLVSDIKEEWKEIDGSSLNKTKTVKAVMENIPGYLDKTCRKWLYIKGASGTGKSFLMTALVNGLVKNGYKAVAFLNAPTRIKELCDLSYTDKESFASLLTKYQKAEILVLDEFGDEFKNDYIRDTIVIPLLSKRAKEGLITFFTSDFTLEEILTLYSTSKAGAIRANQLVNIILSNIDKEIDSGSVSAYK